MTVTARSKAPDLPTFERHWQDEADAAFVYRVLADVEANEGKKDLYLRLAAVEERHVAIWADLMAQHGRVGGRAVALGRSTSDDIFVVSKHDEDVRRPGTPCVLTLPG